MLENSYLILVGGTGRNVGKTEFVCRLIEAISKDHDVFGLKVSAIFPDEVLFHGNHEKELSQFHLFEEKRIDTRKDTSRMLQAGAKKVFYLQSEDQFIEQGYKEFLSLIPENGVIVSESNSLGYFVKPVRHIIVKAEAGPVKPRAEKLLEQADIIISSDGRRGFPEIENICSDIYQVWQKKSLHNPDKA